ncbi:hypothetical protein LFL97_20905 [Burkholderia sp. JSH-S8]|nr:hypothetical protein LFL97_20905 [Burkholderia sp. JSH-S8]
MFVTFVVCLFRNIDAMRQLDANLRLCIGNDIGDCVAREIVSRITHFHLDYLSSSPFRNPYQVDSMSVTVWLGPDAWQRYSRCPDINIERVVPKQTKRQRSHLTGRCAISSSKHLQKLPCGNHRIRSLIRGCHLLRLSGAGW